ncbi:MAG: AMP-binding protein, partial [Burkholderiales bacterium]
VYKRSGSPIKMQVGRDLWWDDALKAQPDRCEPVWVNAEHPLFILYTSGSTGKPKGIQHSTGGYLLWCILNMKWVFDYKASDVFWCTADVGWVTGHSYIAYGPLAVGATEVMFEGVPTYPDAGRFWKIIQNHKVNVFYTAPTAICSFAGDGASTDEEGYYRIVGRIDDVLNVSGHRLGTMEVESALVANTTLVAEAAVVARPDDLTGEAIVAFVVTKGPRPSGAEATKVAQELRNWVAKEIGPIARSKEIRFGDNLPKTRSGKIMRRLLRALAKGEEITQDVSTLENPAILEQLKQTS